MQTRPVNMLDPELSELANQAKKSGINALFNKTRVADFTFEVAGLYVDFSKTHINSSVLDAYLNVAEKINLDNKRQQLFSGHKINITEDRAVLHTALRDLPDNTGASDIDYINKQDIEQARQSQQALLDMLDTLQDEMSSVKNIIHIGIGGSVLGPQLLYQALAQGRENQCNNVDLHFVSNVDGHQLQQVLQSCEAHSTLVIAVSKTFTTLETLNNLEVVIDWFKQHGLVDYHGRVVAVTANADNALSNGVLKNRILTFPVWVGGRYSLWSGVSLSVALFIGKESFRALLRGAADMDQHFLSSAFSQNICFLSAMMDHWYGNYFNAQTRASFAYDYRLRSLVDYLQQLETESNGKHVDVHGQPVQGNTSAIVWGGVGTDVQHSVFQLLHQGTHCIPVEFILVKQADHQIKQSHSLLLANGLAQSAALLKGQTLEQVKQDPANHGLSDEVLCSKVFEGERPSTTILLPKLDAYYLGALIAFYEHRTFCYGILCGINSFDQMGVELGKKLAQQVLPALLSGNQQDSVFDLSTNELLKKCQESD